MENLKLNHCQPPYGHKGTPYNDEFKGKDFHRLGHERKGIIVELVPI